MMFLISTLKDTLKNAKIKDFNLYQYKFPELSLTKVIATNFLS